MHICGAAFFAFTIKYTYMADIKKITTTLESALRLLNKELDTEITNKTKEEYLKVINDIQKLLRELHAAEK